jgi:septum formation protein
MNPSMLLASQSPRRRRLLTWLGVPFETAAVDTPEDLDTPLAADPAALAATLAAEKAEATRGEGLAEGALVLCFDTIVVHDADVLGKPVDEPDAWRMLRSLSGNTHQVVTGVALLCPDDETPRTFSVITDVEMKELSDCRIEAWMAMGTFMGCAGAYNIEAQVASVTEDECYQNVAGLPLCHLCGVLRELPDGCVPPGLTSPVATCDEALGRHCRLGPRILGTGTAR